MWGHKSEHLLITLLLKSFSTQAAAGCGFKAIDVELVEINVFLRISSTPNRHPHQARTSLFRNKMEKSILLTSLLSMEWVWLEAD
jgi:hypothetical protein